MSCPSAFDGQSLSVHLLISRLFTAGYFASVDAHFHELRRPPAKCIKASKANNAACEWLICPVLTSTRLSQKAEGFCGTGNNKKNATKTGNWKRNISNMGNVSF